MNNLYKIKKLIYNAYGGNTNVRYNGIGILLSI